MTEQVADSPVREQSTADVTATGTPAEDREEERAYASLWSLKEEAKWGKDMETQKKAVHELEKIGAPALSYLEEVAAVAPPGEIKQSCQDAIQSIASRKTKA
jgi:hypothetical protein